MTEYYVMYDNLRKSRLDNRGNYYYEIDDDINKNIKEWLEKNPDFIPYGEPKILEQGKTLCQIFVKHSSRLNDKFLEEFLDELKLIPEVGTAYHQAKERFDANIKLTAQPQPTAEVKAGGKNKTRKTRKYRKR